MKSLTASTRQQIPYGEQPGGHRSLARHRGPWWMSYLALTAIFVASAFPCGAQAATVTLPKTGQTLCYNANGTIDCAGTGQDGETQIGATWPVPRFTNNLNGTVTDNLTGLIWLQDALCTALNPPPANPSLSLQGGRDWASALSAANTLMSGQCGLTDGSVAGNWRLPNVNEMESLIDISQSNPPLPANNHFINVPQTLPIYWTSTITGDYFPGINAIGAVLFTGKLQGDVKTSPKYIWPVRGDSTTLARTGQNTCWDPNDSSASGTVVACNGSGTDGALQKGVPLPSPRFFDNVNGTITDSLTGLIWPKNAGCFNNISSQGQAITLAKTLANGTCDLVDGSAPGDWRLPNRKEMRSLVDYGGAWLAEFTSSPPHGWYWTSDSYAVPPDTSQKWVVKSQGLDWLNTELLTYQQLPPYFMLPVRGALKIQRISFGPATITYGDPPIDLSAITTGGGSGNPVTFTLVSGPATLSGTILTATGGGNVVVKASQLGNATYYPAADTLHTFTVVNTNSYTLQYSAAPSGAGSVTAKPSQSTYPSGTQVVLTATPNTGYTFSGWSGDAGGTANPLTVTITGNTSITASFAALPGSLTVTPATALSAAGAPGGPFTPSSATYTLQNSGNAPITWNVSKAQQWVTLSLSGSGSLAPGGTATVTVSLNATAATLAAGNYSDSVIFTNATNGSGNTTRAVNLTVATAQSSNIASLATVTASTQNTSTGQTAVKAVDGVIGGYPGDYTKEWATTGQKTGAWLNLSWSAPYSVNQVVLYDRPNLNDQITTATIAFSDGSSISVGPLNNNGTATTYSFPARVITGLKMTVTGVSSSTGSVGLSEIQVYGTPAGGTQYTLTTSVSPSGAGSVTAKPSQSTYPSGTQVVLTAAPNTGYTFSGWSGDASGTVNPLTVTMIGNLSITANFTPLPGTLAVTPATALSSIGAPAGPFTPASAAYTLQNSGNSALTWSAAQTQPWVTLSLNGGSLAPGATATVTVSINANAATLAAGNYSDSVTFTNATNGSGNTTRAVNLAVTTVQSSNIASLATVTASTQNTSTGQTAVKAVDGVIGGYPGDYTKEWATTGQKTGAWLNLSWPTSHSVTQVVLYDRPNLNDQITAATITFSDGSSIVVGPLNNDGTATTYSFPAKVITGLKMTVTGVSSSTGSVGLSEIQVYGR